MAPNTTMIDHEYSTGSTSFLGFGSSILGGRKQRDPDTQSIISVASRPTTLGVKSKPAAGSDTSSSSGGDDRFDGPSEFVVECKNGEMVFVTAAQGKAVQTRCHHFRNLLAAGRIENDDQIVRTPEWSVATVRRLIELLTVGSTWIENEASCFSELIIAAKEVSVELRLGSLINFHDVLDKDATKRFFEIIALENYQFKFRATVKSWQWMELMKRGILLLLKSKVIMVKAAHAVAPPSKTHPTNERLKKCDAICSDFCVYANGNVNALLTIMDVLSPLRTPKEKMERRRQQEEYKLIFMTRAGSLSHEDLEMIWRITAASYTMSTSEERGFLKTRKSNLDETVCSESSPSAKDSSSNKDSTTRHRDNEPKLERVSESKALIPVEPSRPKHQPNASSVAVQQPEYYCRTMTGTSFLVLKHLFDTMNADNESLSACLMVKAPTPDTLGRLINATRSCQDQHDLGFDLEKNVYFASKSSREMKQMLGYLADYSSSARVMGDFKLTEFQKKE